MTSTGSTPPSFWQPAETSLFFSRGDVTDPRLGEKAKPLSSINDVDNFRIRLRSSILDSKPADRHFVVSGYPDDEGIRTNGGRPGAAEAPDHVRRILYKMTPPLTTTSPDFSIWDLGNLTIMGGPLADRHELASRCGFAALSEGANWITIGGGHDYGFPDADAFIQYCEKEGVRPLIINFDAHLDVRPLDRGLSSGTPFFRMLEKHPEVDFAEIGIQNHCNSRNHLEWALSRGTRVLTQEQVEASGESFTTMVIRLLDDWLLRPRPVFLSIDIDGFSSSVAPGCSQSWATGFTPQDFFPCLELLKKRLDVKALGIYEVSPPLDHDHRTAKLAAQIIHRVMT